MNTPSFQESTSEVERLRAELQQVKAELELLKQSSVKTLSEENPYALLQKVGNDLYEKQMATDLWRGTPLQQINELKPDHAGKVGEEFIRLICEKTGIPNISTGDKNSKDGTYDQQIGALHKKTEIKTARRGGNKYQHETLKSSGFDYLCFLDIHPKGGHLTILPPFTMTETHPVTGTTPSLRKGTTDVFKWDFTDLHLKKLKEAKFSIEFDATTSFSVLGDFIRSKII
jgi:hypothetical protein